VTTVRTLSWALAPVVAFVAATPASAQWTRVTELPVANIYSVWTSGSTITAGSDSTAYVSLDSGATWTTTATVVAGSSQVRAVRFHNGRLYAGTLGEGVFVSDDLGTTWQSFNQGLVGGFANSQLVIMDLLLRGDSLFAATGGSGAWIRNLSSTGGWSRYGDIFGPAQATNMESIAGSPTRLLAEAGFNGDVYHRDRGEPDWSISYLRNNTVAAGLASLAGVWTGHAWLVGTNIGVFRSALGQDPWTYFDFGLHPTLFASFAVRDGAVFTHFASGGGTGIEYSIDDGVSWNLLDSQPGIFTFKIATIGSTLYASRVDGLWRRSISSVSAPAAGVVGLRFAIAGALPAGDQVQFSFELPTGGPIAIEVYDVAGRRVGDSIREVRPSGHGEVSWNAAGLPAGIYHARLTAPGGEAKVRIVRTSAGGR
jgi:hypothetical protein